MRSGSFSQLKAITVQGPIALRATIDAGVVAPAARLFAALRPRKAVTLYSYIAPASLLITLVVLGPSSRQALSEALLSQAGLSLPELEAAATDPASSPELVSWACIAAAMVAAHAPARRSLFASSRGILEVMASRLRLRMLTLDEADSSVTYLMAYNAAISLHLLIGLEGGPDAVEEAHKRAVRELGVAPALGCLVVGGHLDWARNLAVSVLSAIWKGAEGSSDEPGSAVQEDPRWQSEVEAALCAGRAPRSLLWLLRHALARRPADYYLVVRPEMREVVAGALALGASSARDPAHRAAVLGCLVAAVTGLDGDGKPGGEGDGLDEGPGNSTKGSSPMTTPSASQLPQSPLPPESPAVSFSSIASSNVAGAQPGPPAPVDLSARWEAAHVLVTLAKAAGAAAAPELTAAAADLARAYLSIAPSACPEASAIAAEALAGLSTTGLELGLRRTIVNQLVSGLRLAAQPGPGGPTCSLGSEGLSIGSGGRPIPVARQRAAVALELIAGGRVGNLPSVQAKLLPAVGPLLSLLREELATVAARQALGSSSGTGAADGTSPSHLACVRAVLHLLLRLISSAAARAAMVEAGGLAAVEEAARLHGPGSGAGAPGGEEEAAEVQKAAATLGKYFRSLRSRGGSTGRVEQ